MFSLTGFISNPTNTFSSLASVPMIFFTGSGSFLTNVGIAKI